MYAAFQLIPLQVQVLLLAFHSLRSFWTFVFFPCPNPTSPSQSEFNVAVAELRAGYLWREYTTSLVMYGLSLVLSGRLIAILRLKAEPQSCSTLMVMKCIYTPHTPRIIFSSSPCSILWGGDGGWGDSRVCILFVFVFINCWQTRLIADVFRICDD